MGGDAVGQSWSTGLSRQDEQAERPWYSLAPSTAQHRWQRASGERDPLAPGTELS